MLLVDGKQDTAKFGRPAERMRFVVLEMHEGNDMDGEHSSSRPEGTFSLQSSITLIWVELLVETGLMIMLSVDVALMTLVLLLLIMLPPILRVRFVALFMLIFSIILRDNFFSRTDNGVA